MSKMLWGWVFSLITALTVIHYSSLFTFFKIVPNTINKTYVTATSVLSSRSSAVGVVKFQKPLTLDSIFDVDKIVEPHIQGKVVLLATGDVIPARSVNSQQISRNDFTWAFKETADVLKSADITFINLESPLIDKCASTLEGMIFCGDKRNVEGLTFSGVDIANLANNHSGNYGVEGINSTKQLLEQLNIKTTGVAGPTFIKKNNKTFAFLGYNLLSKYDPNKISEEISTAKKSADFVIVQYHWGVEYTDQPTAEQIGMAHLSIDSGADLVLGNHPHWIQPVEIYKGKIITYAHGNFIFDQMWSPETETGVIGIYVFGDKGVEDVSFLPIKIRDYGQAYFPTKDESTKVINKMLNDSKILQNNSK